MDDLALPAHPPPVAIGPVAAHGKLLSFGSLDMAAFLGGDATPTGSLADTPFVSFCFANTAVLGLCMHAQPEDEAKGRGRGVNSRHCRSGAFPWPGQMRGASNHLFFGFRPAGRHHSRLPATPTSHPTKKRRTWAQRARA